MSENSTSKPGDPANIGSGRPPRNGQFQKGKSGNPRGRPPRRRSRVIDERQILADFFEVSEEAYQVTVNGKTIWEPASKIIMRALVAAAANKEAWAIRRFMDMRMQYTQMYTESLIRNGERYDRMRKILEDMGSENLSLQAKALIAEMKRRFENPTDELFEAFKD